MLHNKKKWNTTGKVAPEVKNIKKIASESRIQWETKKEGKNFLGLMVLGKEGLGHKWPMYVCGKVKRLI